jgi:hypothetical protein
MALARFGQIDAALSALSTAELRLSTGDPWGRSVAINGARAHVRGGRPLVDRAVVLLHFARSRDPRSPG